MTDVIQESKVDQIGRRGFFSDSSASTSETSERGGPKSMDLSVKIGHTQPAKMPSSHHEFFAKLYGSLEDNSVKSGSSNSSDLNDSKDKDSVGSNDDESKMPEIRTQETVLQPLKQGASQFVPHFQSSLMNPYMLSDIHGQHLRHPNFDFVQGISHLFPLKNRKDSRPRRRRTSFLSSQTIRLELEFQHNEYISRSKRFELAEQLNLSETQIKIWFQNRRAKDKRIEKTEQDHQLRCVAFGTAVGMSGYNLDLCTECFYHPGRCGAVHQGITIPKQGLPTSLNDYGFLKSSPPSLPTLATPSQYHN